MSNIQRWFSHLQHWQVVIISLGLSLLLGLLDYQTGYGYSFSIFYIFPVAITAWYSGYGPGFFVSAFSAIVWWGSNVLAGETFSDPLMPYWNTITRLSFFTIIAYLLNRLHQSYEYERRLSRTDYLTGVFNRRAFFALLKAEMERQRRHQRPFSLAYIDLDDFKAINDRFGHSEGDRLLHDIATTMAENLRSSDVIARLGGDEFGILLLESNAEQAEQVMRRLQDQLRAAVQVDRGPVTLSIGITTFNQVPDSVDELMKQADAMMYQAKSSGKDTLQQQVYRTSPQRLKSESDHANPGML